VTRGAPPIPTGSAPDILAEAFTDLLGLMRDADPCGERCAVWVGSGQVELAVGDHRLQGEAQPFVQRPAFWRGSEYRITHT
jgi:hypothetical protein